MAPIRTALLSYGTSGKVLHAPLLRANPSYALTGCLERSAKRIANDIPSVKSYATIEELLAADAELVIVNTPNYTHFEYARLCLEAGKHVVIEKPVSLTASEGRELESIAGKKKLRLSVFHNRRWDSDFLTVRKILTSGTIGPLLQAVFRFDRYRPEPGPKAHKEGDLPGAGIHYDIGPHLVDQALQLLGKPEHVEATLGRVRPNAQAVDDMKVTLHYKNSEVVLYAGMLSADPGFAYALLGEKGEFMIARNDPQEESLSKGEAPGGEGWGLPKKMQDGQLILNSGEKANVASEKGDYMVFYNRLAEAIRGNASVPVEASEAIGVVEVIEAAIKSSEKGGEKVAME